MFMRSPSEQRIFDRNEAIKAACQRYIERINGMTQDELREDMFRRGELDYTYLNEPHIIRGED